MEPIYWTTEPRKVKDLIPYKSNPRQISKDQLAQLKRSLEKFDYAELIAVQRDNTIIAGHMRVKAMLQLGWGDREINVRVPQRPLSEEEMREYLIRSNKNTGEWDWDILANEWDPHDLHDWGFTADELVDDVLDLGSTEDDSDVLEPPKDPKTKLGDIYQLGDHRLICGDSTNPDVVAALLQGEEPILMVTDPPYGVSYDASWRGKAGKGTRATGKVQNDEQVNWALAWHLFPGSIAYVWHAGKYCSEVQKSLEEAEYEIISQIIWVKQHFALSRGDYHWQHEPCWYAVKKGHNHNWQGARDQSTVWEISNLNAFGKNSEDERTAHSTQKPLDCMARAIRNNSSEGESVYDPFLGSGTTLIAAENLRRKCYGIELDPAYCDIIIERWMNHRKKNGKSFEVMKNGEVCEDFNG